MRSALPGAFALRFVEVSSLHSRLLLHEMRMAWILDRAMNGSIFEVGIGATRINTVAKRRHHSGQCFILQEQTSRRSGVEQVLKQEERFLFLSYHSSDSRIIEMIKSTAAKMIFPHLRCYSKSFR